MRERRIHVFLLISLSAVFTWSVIRPHDYFTWFLEVLPLMIGVGIVLTTYHRFRLTTLAYFLIWIDAVILTIGGHYTYAEVPLFNWIRDTFHFSRNHYDRMGHLAQGFMPAIVGREILLRTSPLREGKWLNFLVICVCLAISAAYEIFEFIMALATGAGAESFLGTQGDIWDTQWDMSCALIGAVAAVLFLSKAHTRALAALPNASHRAETFQERERSAFMLP